MATEAPRALGKQGLPGPSRTWRGAAPPDDLITSRKYEAIMPADTKFRSRIS